MSPPLEICDRPSTTPKRNELAGLLVELLLSITDFLPVDDTICLSLCNRRLLTIYHHRYHLIRPSGEEKLPLLCRLEQDRPRYFTCHACFVLHKFDPSDFSGLSVPKDYRVRCLNYLPMEMTDLQWNCGSYYFRVCQRFYWLHLHLAMQRFHLGDQFGISTASLSFTQVRIFPTCSPYPELTTLFSIDAQICPELPGLCLRKQQMTILHESRSDHLLPENDDWVSFCRYSRHIFICQHVTHTQWQYGEKMSPVADFASGGQNRFFDLRCFHCNTEARIELREIDSQLALVVTTWINLGLGLTPDDPKWKIHTYGHPNPYGHSDAYGRWVYPICPSYDTERPRASFENASPLSFSTLLERNLACISVKQQQYRKVMIAWGSYPGLWYLPGLLE